VLRSFRLDQAEQAENWARNEPGRTAVELEKQLLQRLWAAPTRQRVLMIGESPGGFAEWFARGQHQLTTLVASPAAVQWSRRRLPPNIDVRQGSAWDLPYEDDEFDTVALIHALEFADDPAAAIDEACRVARKSVLVSVYNRLSLITGLEFLRSFWHPPLFPKGRSHSILAIRRFIRSSQAAAGSTSWRSCLLLPYWTLAYLGQMERSRFCQCQPFGHILVVRIDPVYTLQAVQDPLLAEVAPGAKAAHLHASCWRARQPQRPRQRVAQQPRPGSPRSGPVTALTTAAPDLPPPASRTKNDAGSSLLSPA